MRPSRRPRALIQPERPDGVDKVQRLRTAVDVTMPAQIGVARERVLQLELQRERAVVERPVARQASATRAEETAKAHLEDLRRQLEQAEATVGNAWHAVRWAGYIAEPAQHAVAVAAKALAQHQERSATTAREAVRRMAGLTS